MGANTSGFSKSQPSGSSSIRHGDDLLRSDKSILQDALNDEHYFDPQASASSLSGGIHRRGSARIFSGTRASLATPASADSEGRLHWATDRGSLHYLGTSSHSTIAWGDDPPGARAYSETTTITSGTSTAIILPTENFDVGGYFTAGGSIMTVPSGFSGRHLIIASASFPSAHTGTRRAIAIFKDGAYLTHASAGTHNGGGSIAVNCSIVDVAAAGAFYRIVGYHDSGVAMSVDSIFLTVQKL